MCGGTARDVQRECEQAGLSPRVRGNRSTSKGETAMTRSIPACAGEPDTGIQGCWNRGVYPRVCGGTPAVPGVVGLLLGLSPRVRGNHEHGSPVRASDGSIPACAGEPRYRWSCGGNWKVYPRVCGGTRLAISRTSVCRGLSPRVRGNLAGATAESVVGGSIPACAGEPDSPPTHRHTAGVYPRVCGGTVAAVIGFRPSGGLSPRVRGNPARHRGGQSHPGSIPACAGEPIRFRPPGLGY